MDEQIDDQGGPVLTDEVQEVQGKFPNHKALDEAVAKLTTEGFDRADFSLPDPQAPAATPDEAPAATSEVDVSQVRTMASGLTGAAAGTGVAAILMATGGLAAPLVAVAAGVSALGAAAATTGAGLVRGQEEMDALDRLGAEGKLVLAVRIRSAEKQEVAIAALRGAGATEITAISGPDGALTRGVGSASWTG